MSLVRGSPQEGEAAEAQAAEEGPEANPELETTQRGRG
jgi:hypothetical protein